MTDERVSELDGMRGFGMMIAVAYHIVKRGDYFTNNAVLDFFTRASLYGFYAVDTFFVLSGFLITTILLNTKGDKHYYKNYYARRALRVFPLYYFTIFFILFVVTPITWEEYLQEIPRALPYYLLYMNNWMMIAGWAKVSGYLGITWSLAVEEHFYLPFPILVNNVKKETLAKICAGVIGVSILSRIIGVIFWKDVPAMTNFFYFNTFTRFEEISFGALIAIAYTYPEWKAKLSRIALPTFLITLAALTVIQVVSNNSVPIPSYNNIPLTLVGYTMASILASGLIIALTTHDKNSLIRRIFRNKVGVFWGKHSYSIYLYHVAVGLILLEYLWRNNYMGWHVYFLYIGLTVVITLVISQLTWYLLEKPALDLKRYFEYS